MNDLIQLGQRIHCTLYGGKDGTVVKIHGEQNPGTVRNIFGGAGVTGGRAEMEVVYDNGTRSQVPESLLRGSVQWKIYPEVVGPDKVAAAIAHAATCEGHRKVEAAERARQFEEDKASLIAANPHLKPGAEHVAANIRIELKRAYPGVKFSVRSSRSSSIHIRWEDGPTQHEVDAVVDKFSNGRFDGMTDCYEHRRSPWTAVFGGVNYVCTSREISDQLLDRALDYVYRRLNANLKGIERPDIKGLRGHAAYVEIPHLHLNLSEAVYAVARAWNTHADEIKAGPHYNKARFLLEPDEHDSQPPAPAETAARPGMRG